MKRFARPIRTLALAAALVLSLGALAACGGDDTEANGTDRYFAEMMIPHHQGAIVMSDVELERGENPGMQELAREITAAQEQEIAQMREWRTAWAQEG